MNREELIKKAEVLEKELAELKVLINTPEKKAGRWKPNEGGRYYIVNVDRIVTSSINDSTFDKEIINFSPVFQTEKEAIEYRDKLIFNQQVIDRIAELNDGWKPDWSDNDEHKHTLCFIGGELAINTCYNNKVTSEEKQFKSREIGKTIIKEFDNEKLKNWFI